MTRISHHVPSGKFETTRVLLTIKTFQKHRELRRNHPMNLKCSSIQPLNVYHHFRSFKNVLDSEKLKSAEAYENRLFQFFIDNKIKNHEYDIIEPIKQLSWSRIMNEKDIYEFYHDNCAASKFYIKYTKEGFEKDLLYVKLPRFLTMNDYIAHH